MNRQLALLASMCFSLHSLQGQIIDFKEKIEVSDGIKTTTHSVLIQVNSPSERWLGEVSIPYKEGNEPLIHEAVILDMSGSTVRTLRRKEMQDRSDISYISFYEDDLRREFNLIWNQYPYQIRYSYSQHYDQFTQIANWTPHYKSNVRHLKSSLEVSIPHDYEVRILQDSALTYSKFTNEAATVHYWEKGPSNFFLQEPFAPSYYETVPVVTIIPKYFSYGRAGSFDTWKSYGDWHYAVNQDKVVLPAEEQKKVDRLVKDLIDPRKKIEVLYNYMQSKTKYVNVSIDEGGLIPYPASYVCENGYGDCKALTIYMKALLKQAGIESNYCLVNAGDRAKHIISSLPSQQFNHVILGVPLGQDTVWLENTNQQIPTGYLGSFTQDRLVLWVDQDNSQLVKTPKLNFDDVEESQAFKYELNQNNDATFHLHGVYGGEMFEIFNALHKQNKPEKSKEYVQANVLSEYGNIEELEFDYTENPYEISLHASGHQSDLVKEIGTFKVISPTSVKLPALEKPSRRKLPLRISYPTYQRDSFIFVLDTTVNISEIQTPTPKKINSSYGSYSEEYEIQNREVRLHRTFQLKAGEYSVGEYQAVYTFIQQVSNAQKKSSIIISQ